jgi:hypothetical protein
MPDERPDLTTRAPHPTPWWRTRGGIVLCGFLAIAGFFLLTEHTAHVFGALPWLLVLACPLMHLFMHHGTGGHGEHDGPTGTGGRDHVPSGPQGGAS